MLILPGDRVLVKNVGFKGRHKIQNRWSRESYIVVSQPDLEIPVFNLKSEFGRSSKTVHRKMILPITSVPVYKFKFESDVKQQKRIAS